MRFLLLETRRGNKCELEYASCVARRIAKAIRREGHDVMEVDSPSPSDADEAISSYNPDHVWFIGHGNSCLATLENVNLWVSSERCGCQEKNTDALSGVSANALSCTTAKCLGKKLTKFHGNSWYLGYYDSFVFIFCGCNQTWGCSCGRYNPYKIRDEVNRNAVTCMHESNLFFTLGLAKGYKEDEAHGYSLNRFSQWIKHWEEFEPNNDKEASLANLANTVLRKDKKLQRLVRDGEYVKPATPPTPKARIPYHGVAGALGAAIASVGLVKAE